MKQIIQNSIILGSYIDPTFRPNFAIPYGYSDKHNQIETPKILKTNTNCGFCDSKSSNSIVYFPVRLKLEPVYLMPKVLETSKFRQIWCEGIRFGRDIYIQCIMKNFRREKKTNTDIQVTDHTLYNIEPQLQKVKHRNVVKNSTQVDQERSQKYIDDIKVRFYMMFGQGMFDYWLFLKYQTNVWLIININSIQPIELLMDFVNSILIEKKYG